MKVILNKDLAPLGEEGDVRDVARGYARNFLFPRNIAVPYNEKTVKIFEARKDQIEARKAQKRKDAASLKERLEALTLELRMPAGANGKLYGAVTSQTIMDELGKQGFQIERKRIEVPGTSIKSVGKYRVTLRLYEGASAEVQITVQGQEIKTESKSTPKPFRRKRIEQASEQTQAAKQVPGQSPAPESGENPAGEASPVEAPAGDVPAENTPAEKSPAA